MNGAEDLVLNVVLITIDLEIPPMNFELTISIMSRYRCHFILPAVF